MPSASITTRVTRKGERRYDVRYRLGGRAYPVVRAGTFKTEKDAKARRALVAGEIAHGRNPADLLAALATVKLTAVSFGAWGDRFLQSRIDVDANTIKNYRSSIRKISDDYTRRLIREIDASRSPK